MIPSLQVRHTIVVLGLLVTVAVAPYIALAYDGKPQSISAKETPKELEGVGIEEKLGTYLDPNIKFKNEKGEDVTLGSFFDGKTPTIISPVYYSCPGLCNFHLNGLIDGLKEMKWNVGDKFKVVAVSFDAKENPDLALQKKASYMKVYSRPGTENGWHFLTGSQESIDQLTKAIGFKFRWNAEAKEWAHASAAVVTSPKGEITRYLPGIVFKGQDIKLALNESAEGKIGSLAESLVLYCFQYDRHENKYSLAAFRLVQLGGVLVMLVMAIWLGPVWYRARRPEGQK